MRAALATAGLGLLLAACETPVVGVNLTVATKACSDALSADPQRDPVSGVDSLRIKVTGDGMSPVQVDARFADGGARIPNLALGTNRRISVEARKGSTLWARGDSGRFDLLDGHDLEVTLQLRVVDAFTLAGRAGSTSCSHLVSPRVGHAMTLLPDGRVLITGGFTVDSGGLHYQKDAELYDPGAGTFTTLSASPAYRRQGHAALPLTLGATGLTGVLLAGGEGPTDPNAGGAPAPVRPLELFSAGAWQLVQPAQTSPAREHHAAAVDLKTGYAVLAGGLSGPDVAGAAALDSVSHFDPQTGALVDDPAGALAAPLSDAVAVARANLSGGVQQGGVVLVGGRDLNGSATDQISGLVFSDSKPRGYTRDKLWEGGWTLPPAALQANARLPSPRVRHFAARLKDDSILVVGGLTRTQLPVDYAAPTGAVTRIDPGQRTAADVPGAALSQARADGCGALLEDGSVLYAGGAWRDPQGAHSARSADVVSPDSVPPARALYGPVPGSIWGLQQARHRAACVRLRDGSVLITGGYQYASDGGGGLIVLDTAEVYMPAAPAP